jgi:hypothetical protein
VKETPTNSQKKKERKTRWEKKGKTQEKKILK